MDSPTRPTVISVPLRSPQFQLLPRLKVNHRPPPMRVFMELAKLTRCKCNTHKQCLVFLDTLPSQCRCKCNTNWDSLMALAVRINRSRKLRVLLPLAREHRQTANLKGKVRLFQACQAYKTQPKASLKCRQLHKEDVPAE